MVGWRIGWTLPSRYLGAGGGGICHCGRDSQELKFWDRVPALRQWLHVLVNVVAVYPAMKRKRRSDLFLWEVADFSRIVGPTFLGPLSSLEAAVLRTALSAM